MEKGISPTVDPRDVAARCRRTATILISIGVGIIGALVLVALFEHDWRTLEGSALAIIPLSAGFGLLYEYKLQKRDLRLETDAAPLHDGQE